MVMYVYLFFFIEKRKGIFDRLKDISQVFSFDSASYLARIVFGGILLFAASKIIVDKTIYFTSVVEVSPFVISLLVLGVGTNLPELSVAFRSVFEKKKEVAFGDYLGSASANTFMFGLLVLMQGDFLITGNSFFIAFLFFATILGSFFVFTRSKLNISPLEGMYLLALYLFFIAIEIVK